MAVLAVDRASISTFAAPFDAETVDASDELAARLSDLQLDIGEGPGWDAFATQAPVAVPDVAVVSARWPLLVEAIAALGVNATWSFPLSVGTLKIGAVDLYSSVTDTLTPMALAAGAVLADATATGVLRHALEHRYDSAEDDGPHARREVHQATGMVIAQMRVTPADALLLIRAHAYASGRSVRETAADIIARTISLEPDQSDGGA
ncbi:ANTAR domain-containing protein [Cnuibacter sp. UC19_7]|uniref:ANTAR domain-containing protein n=1 Tax=Cnuibacter sp. UC19_7 TaxID=3350166 RepID=UPI00366DA4DC